VSNKIVSNKAAQKRACLTKQELLSHLLAGLRPAREVFLWRTTIMAVSVRRVVKSATRP
jgi:hypothetical protein